MNKQLAAFLAADARPEGTMILPELYGFLFAVCCAPEPVMPSEWLPLVFNGEDAGYGGEPEVKSVLESLMAAYSEVNESILAGDPALPEWCEILEPPLDNFGDEAPLRHWASGVLLGHDWLSELWSVRIDEDDNDLAYALSMLFFFADKELAKSICKETNNPSMTVERMAEMVVDNLARSMSVYARMGRTLAQAYDNSIPFVREGEKVGRNDPCVCGSGKKYKKCCMTA